MPDAATLELCTTPAPSRASPLEMSADDFGRSPEINAAIIEAHRSGALDRASLMVAGDAAVEAIELARQNPTLAIGLHLVVVCGASVLRADEIPDLVDRHGNFGSSPLRVGLRYGLSRSARRQLARELRAQFEAFRATGLRLAHVDGHLHMHLHPAVFDQLVPLLEEYAVPRVRVPRDDFILAVEHDRRHVLRKAAWTAALGALARRARPRLRQLGIEMPDRTYGFMQTGRMTADYVVDVLRQVRPGLTEIYFHPTTGARVDSLGPNPGDLAALVDPRVVRELNACRQRLSLVREEVSKR